MFYSGVHTLNTNTSFSNVSVHRVMFYFAALVARKEELIWKRILPWFCSFCAAI